VCFASYILSVRRVFQIAIKDNAKRLEGPPDRIIFYRDGVSESEFQQVQAEEITAVQGVFCQHPVWCLSFIKLYLAAIDSCYRGWEKMGLVNNIPKPKLTFVVVGKRFVVEFLVSRLRTDAKYPDIISASSPRTACSLHFSRLSISWD
jgi:eukaryotic translation initiation factor 2C